MKGTNYINYENIHVSWSKAFIKSLLSQVITEYLLTTGSDAGSRADLQTAGMELTKYFFRYWIFSNLERITATLDLFVKPWMICNKWPRSEGQQTLWMYEVLSFVAYQWQLPSAISRNMCLYNIKTLIWLFLKLICLMSCPLTCPPFLRMDGYSAFPNLICPCVEFTYCAWK